MNIYLAGTVTNGGEHIGWRKHAEAVLREAGHVPVNPIRFQNPEHFTNDGLHDTSVPDSFMFRVDIRDVLQADAILLVYWTSNDEGGARRQSVGTWAEFGIATYLHIPVVVVTNDPNVANHPFIRQGAAVVVDTVKKGLDWILKTGV